MAIKFDTDKPGTKTAKLSFLTMHECFHNISSDIENCIIRDKKKKEST